MSVEETVLQGFRTRRPVIVFNVGRSTGLRDLIPAVNRIFGGFRAPHHTVSPGGLYAELRIAAGDVRDLSPQLQLQAPEIAGFGSKALILDELQSFDPYLISEILKQAKALNICVIGVLQLSEIAHNIHKYRPWLAVTG